ncbi:CHMP6 (predicted) [Pycnogonum litorale]
MGILFGKHKSKQSRVTEQDKAVLQLKNQRDKLKQYQKKISINLEKEKEVARKLLKDGKKDRALMLLKKKRFQEQLLTKTDNQLDNLETMVHDLEYGQIEMKVIEGLKIGNESLNKMHEIMSVEDVERIMDETEEGIAKQKEIDELISGSLTEEDDSAVMAELDKIINETLPEVPTAEPVTSTDVPELPDIPTAEPAGEEKTKKILVAA